jgi:hypothetical protein
MKTYNDVEQALAYTFAHNKHKIALTHIIFAQQVNFNSPLPVDVKITFNTALGTLLLNFLRQDKKLVNQGLEYLEAGFNNLKLQALKPEIGNNGDVVYDVSPAGLRTAIENALGPCTNLELPK